ncbi:type II toxin-antitoxin system VapC family toxin [Candidatus Sumerlaeota bacterium]|nr:type II toxin-antitoxin system VapC family toxin [Candidatus Sumerlaeota bacterium]
MYLVDTNVWLELLLEQEKAGEVLAFLQNTDARDLVITDFSLHSIGVILTRLNKESLFEDFLTDTIEDSGVGKVHLDTAELKQVLVIGRQFRIDFDDSYQYVAAEKYGCALVSFDTDFDRTERGRKTPAGVLSA